MNILITAGLFYPSRLGGPANTLYWLAKGFVKNGYKVTVVSSNQHIDKDKIRKDEWSSIDNIRVRYCTAKTKLAFRVIWYSIKELKKTDVVILSSTFYIPCIFVALAAHFYNKKTIWSPRGELFDTGMNNNHIKKLYVYIIKLLFAKNVLFHATSIDEKNQIVKYLGEKVSVCIIPNYIELPKKQLKIQDTNNYILYLGRIAPIKALENLLKALSISNKFIDSDFKLLIVGGCEVQFEYYLEILNAILNNDKQLKDKVIFYGNVEGEEKFKLYANAYFTFLVSHSENFGNVVIESLSQGTPVVASQGTPWKILEQRVAGIWIENSPIEIAKCLDLILSFEKNEYLIYRENAFKLVKEFDVYSNIDKWIEIF